MTDTAIAAPLRVVVIGCGSIGLRHLSNLRTLGAQRIVAVDVDADRRARAADRFGVATLARAEDALADQPDLTLIATPPSTHLELAVAAARAGSHLFIEKPLADRSAGVDELIDLVRTRDLVALVACNMRFHHGPATIKRLLAEDAIGMVVTALLDAGQYLPDWHPEEDHRKTYSARAELGGGVVLDGIHELDYARWLFGEIRAIAALSSRRARLGIETESAADMLIEFESGVTGMLHVDYVQRAYARTCKVIGDAGTILWEISQNMVRIFRASSGRWESFEAPPGYTINDMYLEEARHLLRCIDRIETPSLTITDAARVLEIALAARSAAVSREVWVWGPSLR